MIKTDPKLKEITIYEKGKIVDTVSDYIVSVDDFGTVKYMPYLKDYAMTTAIALYAIDGVKFEKDDNIYDIITNDEIIDNLIECFYKNTLLIKEIESYIDDVIDFKKNYMIHNNNMLNSKLLEILKNQKDFEEYRYKLATKEHKILDQQIKINGKQIKAMENLSTEELESLYKKMASGEYDQQKIANAVVKSYMDVGLVQSDKNNVVNIQNKNNSFALNQKNRQTSKNNNNKNSN